MRHLVYLLMCIVPLLLAEFAHSNPLPPSEIPALERALRVVVQTRGRKMGPELIYQLSKHGFRIVPNETLTFVRRHMPVLEPYIIASQRITDRLHPSLHRACPIAA